MPKRLCSEKKNSANHFYLVHSVKWNDNDRFPKKILRKGKEAQQLTLK
jgi:hypothetical protein